MNYHKILQKQIKKYLTVESTDNPSVNAFIESVNESYLAFERDKEIMDNSFKESEKEYNEINNQLKKEIELKKLAANNLYESINKEDLDYDINYDHNDDLLFVSEYLQAQINKRKKTEENLYQNNELLKTLLSNFQSGIMAEDENRKIIFANQIYCDMRNIKLAPEELVGIDCSKLIHEAKLLFKNPQHFIDKTNKILRNKKLVLGELIKTADNKYIERDYIPIFIDKEYKGHLWKYTDVTSKIQTLELLKQSDEHNRLIMNSSLNSIFTFNTNTKQITFWNSQAEELFGWSKEEAIGKNMIDLIIPSLYKGKWNKAIENFLISGEDSYFNKQLEFVLVNKAGKKFFGEASIIPIIQNEETFFCAFLQDISKRKEAEKNLLKTVELLKTLLANLQSGVLVEDENRRILFTNQLFCDLFSIPDSPEKMIGIDCTNSAEQSKEFFKDSESFSSRIDSILNKKVAVTDELLETIDNRFLARDYVPIFINEEYKGHLWKYTDVTQRIQNQKLLEQSEERTQIIMNSALNAIVTADAKGKIFFWNDQAEIVFGWKEEEVLGKIFTDFMIPERNRDLWNYSIYQYLNEGHNEFLNQQVELFGVKKSGEEFLAEVTITPVTQNGETFFCAFLQDISKRKEAENQLQQTVELLKTLLANLQSGVLVEDENLNILFSNQLFWDLRNIPISAAEMEGINYSKAFEEVQYLFKDSESFVPRIKELLNKKQPVVDELLETTDNRFLDREYIPIFINEEYKGHLWKYTDVTQKIQNRKLLEQSEQRNSLIMNSSLNAIINVDDEGVITFWNRQATIVFGWEPDEIIGKLLVETILPNQNKNIYDSKIRNRIKKIDDTSFKKNIELIGVKQNGEKISIDCSIIPINQNERSFFCLFIQDITEKKEAENIRKIQEEKYQNVIAHMNLGLLEVDNNEIIQYANHSFSAMSGYEVNELIGKNPSDIFVFGEYFEIIKAKNELRKKGTSDIYQLPTKNKDGEQKWWAISGAPNYDNKGNVIGSIGIHLDITEQKQLEIDLEKEKTKALESSKAKEVFLANMSHEIRTPLNAIIGFLRELDKHELSELQKTYIQNSSIASKHLLSIINNILDISKIEAGEMSLESEDFVFEKSISNVATVMQPSLDQKGLGINITISKKIEKVLVGDTLRLQQILFNLIGNAIKFTNNGSISIDCEVVENHLISQELRISISDTGIGMESSYIKNIFNKFSQEDKAITRKYGGTGLGLSITNELVKLMGGRIEIESEKNVGTTFNIYLNFPKTSNQFTEEMGIDQPVSRIDNISILLVEDNFLNRMVAQNSLQYYNCKVTEAENGVEAIKILKDNQFDIILMDIQMPEMGGIEATEIIRNKLHLTTPIIALTANAFKTEIDKCKKAGMDDYVPKPFDEDILIETIAKHTTNKKKH
jgi:PAS domain S-box-containing protein